MQLNEPIPVLLIAYARPAHLRRVLACLRAERVPLLYAFADAPRTSSEAAAVDEVRRLLAEITWTEVRLTLRQENLGLGRNVRAAIAEVAQRHEAFVVWEDDLICMPGTYAWLCAALRHYANVPHVMSVSAWTHPRVTPPQAGERPYFDGRAECWVWGAYARSWPGMESTAEEKRRAIEARGEDPAAYGADLPRMAAVEEQRNIWAVRWLYHHLENRGLCLRPPWSMVEHIGFDAAATNAAGAASWANPALRPPPLLTAGWPAAVEHPACRALWQSAIPAESAQQRWRTRAGNAVRRVRTRARHAIRKITPPTLRRMLRRWREHAWFRGDYANWEAARAASGGYDAGVILDSVLRATLQVQAGHAAFERDSVLFMDPEPEAPLLEALAEVCRRTGRPLRVLDFGGSLGTTFWRLRHHLDAHALEAWDVVEQPNFVDAGRQYLREPRLRFFGTLEEAERVRTHDVLLCSGTLQYLERPAEMLRSWAELSVPHVVLNNLPLHADRPTRLRVQHVPPEIYTATYPVWFFNRAEFLSWVAPNFEIVREFAAEAVWPVDRGMYRSTGMLLRRRPTTAQ